MKTPWEDRLPYTVLAQKRRDIQTRQIGRRKEKSIHTIEVLMNIAMLGDIIFLLPLLPEV